MVTVTMQQLMFGDRLQRVPGTTLSTSDVSPPTPHSSPLGWMASSSF